LSYFHTRQLIVVREKRPYVEGEVVIKPVLESFVEIFEGEVFQKTVRDAITGVALSNNTITRRIESMGKDLREQIYEDFRSSHSIGHRRVYWYYLRSSAVSVWQICMWMSHSRGASLLFDVAFDNNRA